METSSPLNRYLLADTPEAQQARDNLIPLLESAKVEDIRLAFQMIEGGGLHMETLLVIAAAFYPWRHYPWGSEISNEYRKRETAIMDWEQRDLPREFLFVYSDFETNGLIYHDSIKMPHIRALWLTYKALNLTQAFADVWAKSYKLRAFEEGTEWLFSSYFLEHPNKLIGVDMVPETKNRHWMKPILEIEREDVDMVGLYAMYLKGGVLDLSNTAIARIPESIQGLTGVSRLILTGSKIRSLPKSLLLQIKSLKANAKVERSIHKQYWREGDMNAVFGKRIRLRRIFKGLQARNYQEVMSELDAIYPDLHMRHVTNKETYRIFWERMVFLATQRDFPDELLLPWMKYLRDGPDFKMHQLKANHWYQLKERIWRLGLLQARSDDPSFRKQELFVLRGMFEIRDRLFFAHALRSRVNSNALYEALEILARPELLELTLEVAMPWDQFFQKARLEERYDLIVSVLERYSKAIADARIHGRLFFNQDRNFIYFVWECLQKHDRTDVAKVFFAHYQEIVASEEGRGRIFVESEGVEIRVLDMKSIDYYIKHKHSPPGRICGQY